MFGGVRKVGFKNILDARKRRDFAFLHDHDEPPAKIRNIHEISLDFCRITN